MNNLATVYIRLESSLKERKLNLIFSKVHSKKSKNQEILRKEML